MADSILAYISETIFFPKYGICPWTQHITEIFITGQIQWKIVTKFFNKLKNPYFWPIFSPFSQFLGQKSFSKKKTLPRTTSYGFLPKFRTNDPIPKKTPWHRWNVWRHFIGSFPLLARVQKMKMKIFNFF